MPTLAWTNKWLTLVVVCFTAFERDVRDGAALAFFHTSAGSHKLSSVSLAVSPFVSQKKIRLRDFFRGKPHPDGEDRKRLLEIRWLNIGTNVSIALYRHPPSVNVSDFIERVYPQDQSSGFYVTSFSLPRVDTSGPDFKLSNDCMYFWVAVLDSRMRPVDGDCFRGFPFWMAEARRYLNDTQVRRAFIPGTHNSGTYDTYDENAVRSRVTQYVECQDESVFNQLFYGARYFELRASFSPKRRQSRPGDTFCSGDDSSVDSDRFSNNYRAPGGGGGSGDESGGGGGGGRNRCRPAEIWSYHGWFTTRVSFNEIARDIRRFLEATQEVVLIDLHKFKIRGKWFWTLDLHLELWQLLVNELGHFMAPHKEDVTFGELWRSNRRLIVSTIYPMQNLSSCIWPAPLHIWANTDRLSQLELFFDTRLCDAVQSSSRISVLKGQLTPRAGLNMVRNAFRNQGGVRYFTPNTNRLLDRMYRGKWSCANVVAVDYLLSSDVVRSAVFINAMRNNDTFRKLSSLANLFYSWQRNEPGGSSGSWQMSWRWRGQDEL